ncbi:FAD-dependent oxidoreductase [Paraburkholderia sp. BR10954]|uniref:FAD-dependent oxidoreductase n=1 Tax=Paraburkholderia sp. BR10954 TaxID=3236995 RepID=UPI0034D2BC7A
MIETDVLVVGAGPAGAASSLFLSKHGVSNMAISRSRSTARTPRAHITNQRTMEALRDVGLEQQCMALSSPASYMEHHFWLTGLGGEELGRTYAWGNDPSRKSDYETASPCSMCDLPQTHMEPILLAEAARLGSQIRFDTELISFEQDEAGVTATIRDLVAGKDVQVRAKYMIGADGGRSRVVEQLGIPLVGQHGLGNVFNVLVDVDLSDYVNHRRGIFYQVIQPDSSSWGPVGVFRMVRPWDQWIAIFIVPSAVDAPTPTTEDFEKRIRELVGDPDLPMKIVSSSMWTINDVVAEYYSVGRVLCMGDAVHRHPPANGLGSNTCIQDAFNLAWKLAFVLQGKAHARLLDSFNAERQPVGRQIVTRANKSMWLNAEVYDLLGGGIVNRTHGHGAAFSTREGRAALNRALDMMKYEQHAHGVELNRRYVSDAVIADGSPDPGYERDAELYYQPSTRPGSSLPHAWLGTRKPGARVSTLDVAGKQRFTLLTGHGGEPWRDAARAVSERTGVEIAVVSIGPSLDYEDLYGRWRSLSEVEEDGCILVRPDLHVGWRSATLSAEPREALEMAMTRILGLQTA